MKKSLARILSAALLLGLFAGCGKGEPQSSETRSSAPAAAPEKSISNEVASTPAEAASAEPAEFSAAEMSAPTGAVIPAEECQAQGYQVKYGMYDFETYVALPLTNDDTHLSYWFMMQPFMMGYNNVSEQDFTYFKEMEARTGVKLDLRAISMFSVSEQFSLMVTSGDYADMIEGATAYYSGGGSKAIADGFLMDMNDYLDVMPNYVAWLDSDPSYRRDITTMDGGIAYAALFGETERNVGPQLRGDWLDALGLELPTTYDEYHDVLTAFQNTYGAGLWLDSNGAQRNDVLSAGYNVHSNNSDPTVRPFRVIDGVVEYSARTEDYRDYITMLHGWWQDGLIYRDFLSQQSVSSPDSSLVLNNNISVWASDSGTMETYDSLTDDIDIRPAPLPRREPEQTLHLYDQTGKCGDGTSISTTCVDPELAARWLDYCYTYDGTLLYDYGIEGEGLTFDGNGSPMYTDLVLNNPDMITVACSLLYSKFGGAGVVDAYRFAPGYTEKQNQAIALWVENLDTDYELPGAVQFTTEESSEYSTILSDLDTYAYQATLQFITGERSIDTEWDSYLEALNSLKLEQIEALCQTAYDRYMDA